MRVLRALLPRTCCASHYLTAKASTTNNTCAARTVRGMRCRNAPYKTWLAVKLVFKRIGREQHDAYGCYAGADVGSVLLFDCLAYYITSLRVDISTLRIAWRPLLFAGNPFSGSPRSAVAGIAVWTTYMERPGSRQLALRAYGAVCRATTWPRGKTRCLPLTARRRRVHPANANAHFVLRITRILRHWRPRVAL